MNRLSPGIQKSQSISGFLSLLLGFVVVAPVYANDVVDIAKVRQIEQWREYCVPGPTAKRAFEINIPFQHWWADYGRLVCQDKPLEEIAVDMKDVPVPETGWSVADHAKAQSLKSEDLMYRGSPYEEECRISDFESGDICSVMRQRAADAGRPISMKAYINLERMCGEAFDGDKEMVRPCIADFFTDEWLRGEKRELGPTMMYWINRHTARTERAKQRAAQKSGAGGLFDTLMKEEASAGNAAPTQPQHNSVTPRGSISLSAAMAVESQSGANATNTTNTTKYQRRIKHDPLKPDTGFGSIYAGREAIALKAAKENLFDVGEVIAAKCQCVFMDKICYMPPRYNFDELKKAATDIAVSLSGSKHTLCGQWKTYLRGKTSDDLTLVNTYTTSSNDVLERLNKLDDVNASTTNNLKKKQREVQVAIRKREQARKQAEEDANSFQWGKFLASTTGVLIGASGNSIPPEAMAKIMGSVIQDSMPGVEGVGNFKQTLDDLAQVQLSNLESSAEVIRQAELMANTPADAPLAVVPAHQTPSDLQSNEGVAQAPAPSPYDRLLGNRGNENGPQSSAGAGGLCTPSGITGYPENNIYWDGSRLSCADGSSPQNGHGYWAWLVCPSATERVEAPNCQGDNYRRAGLAACRIYPNEARRVQCECEYGEVKRSDSYCAGLAQ